MTDRDLIAGIDAGGTTFKLLLARSDGTILSENRVATQAPAQTVTKSAQTLREMTPEGHRVTRLGIAAFGPLNLRPASPEFGALQETPKAGWSGFNLKSAFEAEFPERPVFIDLDVNAALGAECTWGAGVELHTCAYVTVGTGIGVGIKINGNKIGHRDHPEIGHIPVSRSPLEAKEFSGQCVFHDDCLEGYASAPALIARFGGEPSQWQDDHLAWQIEGHYLAQLCRALTYTIRPQRIILGGGVMNRQILLEHTRRDFRKTLGGYACSNLPPVQNYIVHPGLGAKSGELGAILLALQARELAN